MQIKWTLIALALVFMACGKSKNTPSYPETTEGLSQLTRDVFQSVKAGETERTQALIASMKLPKPDAWFKTTFGDAVGAKLAAEYTEMLPEFDKSLTELYTKMVNENQMELKVASFNKSGDPAATGLQNAALGAMAKPATLYSLRMLKPSEDLGMHLWSFVYVDGTFRLAGKMRAVSP
jgi:hypothetical protein